MSSRYRIHPAIGIARMGNSPEHFVGPETPGVPPNWDDATQAFKSFRDKQGRILRQGAPFRVFEYKQDAAGNFSEPKQANVDGEIVSIEWRVHLANRKASFFVFYGQLGADDLYLRRSDLPARQQVKDDPARSNLRNSDVPEAERVERLDIDPGEKLISKQQPGPVELTNTKTHIPIKSLGTLLLDEKGRLTVLGGYGESNSSEVPPRKIDEYASNDTWFDDASDGSVKARITFKDGTMVDADPAWVMVGPPDFAPAVGNVVSLYDTLWDTAVRSVEPLPSTPLTPRMRLLLDQKRIWKANNEKSLSGYKPSFLREIYPLLKRALGVRDVHISGTANQNYHSVMLGDWAALSALGGEKETSGVKRMRQAIFQKMRDPDSTEVKWDLMPRGLGDEYTDLDNESPTPRSFLNLTRIQYALLREWADRNFVDDWPPQEPQLISKSDPDPDELDQAAVENSVGGPFYPGIDVSWLIRRKELFTEPLRLNIPSKPEDVEVPEPFKIGALVFRSGFFSQQMALPWQADFYDCHKEDWEDPDGNEYYFMWWTAHRPDDVFPSGSTTQVRWVREFDKRALDPNDPDSLENLERFNQMQSRWFELKFISVKKENRFEEEP